MAATTFILFSLLSAVKCDDINPIQAVIGLITQLEGKLMKEGELEAKAYKEFFEWCDDAAKEKHFEIKTSTGEKEKLESVIGKATSDEADAAETIGQLAGQIASDEADLKASTAIRAKEQADFAVVDAELADGVDTLGRAIGILERELGGSALLQTKVDTAKLDNLVATMRAVIDAAAISGRDGAKLLSLVQNKQSDDDDDAALGAPAPDAYKSKSGGIVDVLNEMKEEAEGELKDARKTEMNSKHNFEMLKTSLTDGLEAANKELAEAKENQSEAVETKAVAEGDLGVCAKSLSLAQGELSNIGADCMQKASDHDISLQGRADELKALGVAKKTIQQATSLQQMSKTSFLQLSSTAKTGSRLQTASDLKNFEVVNVIKKLAAQHHSTALAQLASRIATTIRYGHASGDDPFVKVKGLINEMIDKLLKEAEEEAGHKAYCDEEMAKTKAKKEELNADLDKLNAKIDQASSHSVALKEDVKTLQKELAELADSTAEMNKVREDTHAAFVEVKAELDKGIDGITKALKVLRDYYEAEASLLQENDGKFDAFMQQPAVPEQHAKASGAGGGIIDMLEVILSDFSKNLAEEEAEEASAQADYDSLTQENKITKATKEADVKYKTKEHESLDKNLAEWNGDRAGTQTELDAVLEYDVSIKDQCVAKPEPYEERKKRREAEIAGLKEALSILEGQAFLQRRSIGAHRRM